MDQSNNSVKKNMAMIIAVVTLVVGLAVGFGAAKATNKKASTDSMSMSTSSASSTKAVGLRTTLVTLGIDHMTLTNQAVDAALDGTPNASAAATALYTNGTDIGAAVGSVYGKDAETTFNTVWKIHLDDFVKYAVAGSTGDKAGQTAALTDIQTKYTKPLATYLAKANPNLPEATLESALADHVDMTAKMIDMHIAKDYAGEQSELSMANTHIAGLFGTLSDAIVKQYPSKF
jgi:uncharacterized membrane-anchored protein YhcB (DUF1043 family)